MNPTGNTTISSPHPRILLLSKTSQNASDGNISANSGSQQGVPEGMPSQPRWVVHALWPRQLV